MIASAVLKHPITPLPKVIKAVSRAERLIKRSGTKHNRATKGKAAIIVGTMKIESIAMK